jgi:phosphoglycolate phosphatase
MIVVFDLDGTLVDSAADLAASANELVTSMGGRSLETREIIDMIGEGAGVLVSRALAAAGLDAETPDALARFLDIYDRRLLETTVAYPGVRETLALLAPRVRMAVLTNKPQKPSAQILEGVGLADLFDSVIGGDSPLGKKPDPSALGTLIGSSPDGALLVGDSPIDWQTATNSGCPFVWARYGFGAARFGTRRPETPYVIDEPRELIGIVDRLSAVMRGA